MRTKLSVQTLVTADREAPYRQSTTVSAIVKTHGSLYESTVHGLIEGRKYEQIKHSLTSGIFCCIAVN